MKRAAAFAAKAHAGQVRRYTGEPYVTHCFDVASIVRTVPHTAEMLCAALLHDTVEDTDVTPDNIRTEFGPDVAVLVEMLTDVSVPTDGNRAVRKAIDRAHSALASPAAKTVKLADLISNSISICAYDPDFARVYLAEKALLLPLLSEGDPVLWARADALLEANRHLMVGGAAALHRALAGYVAFTAPERRT